MSWQVVPIRLYEMPHNPDQARTERVTEALLQMIKLDIAAFERAYS